MAAPDLAPTPEPSLWMILSGGIIPVGVADISIGEGILQIRVACDRDPRLAIAERVDLAVHVDGRGAPLRAAARVQSWSGGRNHNLYTLRCPVRVVDGMASLFSGRRNVRVAPEPGAPLDAFVCVEGGALVPAEVTDVSRGGMGLEISPEDEPTLLSSSAPLHVWVTLEEGGPAVELVGHMRRRWLSGTRLRLGLQFEHSLLGEQAGAAGEAVHAFVHGRQVAMIAALRQLGGEQAAA